MDIDRVVALTQNLAREASVDGDHYQFLIWWNGVGDVPEDLAAELMEVDIIAGEGKNVGVTEALHRLYLLASQAGAGPRDVLLYLHDDVEIMEEWWDEKLALAFAMRPEMAIAGFGGARGLGDPDLYTKPYELVQLARRDFISNMKSAEQHGARVLRPQRVATLDLFSMGIRMDFLDKVGGWGWWPHVHHGLDNAMCAQAHRHGKEVWMLPFACEHFGGRTSTTVDFQSTFGKAEGDIHAEGHVTLYEDFKDVLPIYIPEQVDAH